jgi:hypothetical protein
MLITSEELGGRITSSLSGNTTQATAVSFFSNFCVLCSQWPIFESTLPGSLHLILEEVVRLVNGDNNVYITEFYQE